MRSRVILTERALQMLEHTAAVLATALHHSPLALAEQRAENPQATDEEMVGQVMADAMNNLDLTDVLARREEVLARARV